MRRVAMYLAVAIAAAAQPVLPDFSQALEWRLIGPFRGGRVVAVAGIPGDQATFYFGSVGGGVWKTTDAGTVWRPIFDRQPIASIGAIAVAPSAPEVIYVGTGEADIRSQIGFGDGVYKSTDGGAAWTNIGLRDSRQISKIVVDPANPEVVYVAALGHAYGPNAGRGVFRSRDGGAHWEKVLYRGPDIGAADLALDPANPKTLYACMWNGRRPVWSQYAPLEGPGSGMFRSTDGGDHWTELKASGLPEARWGRSGVAVAPGSRVYALVQAQSAGGLYRSDDAGASWTRVSGDARLTSRAWYFSGIAADPRNRDLVYVPNVALYRSTDGGQNFTVLKGAPGGDDYHMLWLDPLQPRRMILGSDQGTNISVDAGATWSTWYNQPTAQMYHAIADNRFPYTVFGSQQDSGTAAVMSRTDYGEIDARHWSTVGGGESGYIAIDTRDDSILYVGNTGGELTRFDRRTGQAQNITPWPLRTGGFAGGIAGQRYRFPWTAPLVTSPIEPGALYYGAQYVLKTTDGGLTWAEISPDLTGNTRPNGAPPPADVTAENAIAAGYGVVYAIAPSPRNAAVIWAGSDTGLIHVTLDGGHSWRNVTPPGLPPWSKISQIDASHFDPAVAYVSVDRHRMEDYKPYIYRTRDYGKTWTLLDSGLAEPAYVNAVREDPVRRGLLYAATELGIAVSFDDGGRWQPLQLNLPAVSVRDLIVHGDDLIAATHGRGFWILDDVAPLREIDARVASAGAYLFKPAKAIRTNPEGFMGTPFPPEEPKAKNPPEGAIIDYALKSADAGEVRLEIFDAAGAPVRRYSSATRVPAPRRAGAIAEGWIAPPRQLTAHAGVNRFVWDLRYAAPGAELGEPDDFGRPTPGPQVAPGSYQVRLTAAGKTYTQPLEVALDPRSAATPDDIAKQLDLSLKIAKTLREAAQALSDIRALHRQPAPATPEKLAAADAQAAALRALSAQLTTALAVAGSADRTPPATAYRIYENAARQVAAHLQEWRSLR